jgi:Putative beta-barrel porin-2, OmpL-like. bbp2
MKKALLATAVSAAFAVPTTVLAQAAAAPTLDKVLEASGISVSGYVDTAYSHANRNLETGFTDRVFDSQNNSFVLHQFGLTVAKQPKEGAGGLVNLTAGRDAQFIHSFPESAGTANSLFDITQAYGQYASGPLTLMAGKFVTLHGTEVIASSGNTNFSRSILFGSVPFTHTGLRAVYTLSDTVSITAGVNNGWDQLQDTTKGKTLELGTSLTPIKPLTISASGYFGKETTPAVATPGANEGKRSSANVVATYTVSDALSVGGEYLRVQQENFPSLSGGSPIKAKYDGLAAYATYMISPKLRAAFRAETFKDTDGLRFGSAGGAGTKYKEATATLAYLPSASFELRGELRRDTASNSVFNELSSSNMSKTLMTYAVQALYKF